MNADGVRYCAALLVMLVSGCVVGEGAVPKREGSNSVEPLHSVSMGNGQVEVVVTSRGCTEVASFEVRVTKPSQLAVVRLHADRCRRAPFTKVLLLEIPEAGDKWVVVNPLTAAPQKRSAK